MRCREYYRFNESAPNICGEKLVSKRPEKIRMRIREKMSFLIAGKLEPFQNNLLLPQDVFCGWIWSLYRSHRKGVCHLCRPAKRGRVK
jgi:hypothetical protein